MDKCKRLELVRLAGGSGKIIRETCEKCRGKGKIKKQTKITVTIPAGITQATLGADIKVPMVDGTEESFRIPEGTQTGSKFRIRQKGFTSINRKV